MEILINLNRLKEYLYDLECLNYELAQLGEHIPIYFEATKAYLDGVLYRLTEEGIINEEEKRGLASILRTDLFEMIYDRSITDQTNQ